METVKACLEEARLQSRNLDLASVATITLLLLSKGSLLEEFPSGHATEVAHVSLALLLLMDKTLSPVLVPT